MVETAIFDNRNLFEVFPESVDFNKELQTKVYPNPA